MHIPSVVRAYFRLCSLSPTLNQLNALHIEIERKSTVEERQAFITQIESRVGKSHLLLSRLKNRHELLNSLIPSYSNHRPRVRLALGQLAWRNSMLSHSRKGSKTRGKLHSRKVLAPGVLLYKQHLSEKAQLLVVWAGASHRFGMPTANLLQEIRGLNIDILLVSPWPARRYEDGLKWLGESLEDRIQSVANLVGQLQYDKISVTAVSAGCFPALVFATKIKAERTMVVGPRLSLEAFTEPPGSNIVAFFSKDREGFPDQSAAELAYVCGIRAKKDITSAEELGHLLGGAIITVPDAGHSPIFELFEREQLRGLLSQLFAGDFPATSHTLEGGMGSSKL